MEANKGLTTTTTSTLDSNTQVTKGRGSLNMGRTIITTNPKVDQVSVKDTRDTTLSLTTKVEESQASTSSEINLKLAEVLPSPPK